METNIRFIVVGDKFATETSHALVYIIYHIAQQYVQNGLLRRICTND